MIKFSRQKKAIFILGLVVLLASGCATQAKPEEVCSSEWISKRTSAAMSEFERDVRPMMRTLRKSGSALQSGNFRGIQTARLLNAATKMLDRMEKSQALKDVRLVGQTCNDPDLLITTFSQFMEDQGVPQQAIDMLKNAQSLINGDT